jgi:hypothetical protein
MGGLPIKSEQGPLEAPQGGLSGRSGLLLVGSMGKLGVGKENVSVDKGNVPW